MIKSWVEWKQDNLGKSIKSGILSDKEVDSDKGYRNEYMKYVSKEEKQNNIDAEKAIEKASFIQNAVKVLGQEKVIECFKNARSNKDAALKAINDNSGVNSLIKDEIEYELSLIK